MVDDGNMLGEMPTAKAIEIAQSKGLDLVAVAPNQKPPVCKILSYSKLKYEESKKARKGRIKGKTKDLKEMRFPTTIEDGDIQHKLKRVKEFLSKGHNVKITVYFKGRTSREKAEEVTEKILTELKEISIIDQTLKKQGRRWFMTVMPAKIKPKIKKEE